MWSFVAKGLLWKSDWSRFTDHPIKLYAWPTNVNSVQDWDKLLVADLVAIHSLTHVFVGQLSFYDGFVEVTERHLFHLHRHLFNSKVWSHPMQCYSMIDDRWIALSQIPTIAEKYQTCLIFLIFYYMKRVWYFPREANFSRKFRRTREETAEKTASQDILFCSFLTCAVGLMPILVFPAPVFWHVTQRSPKERDLPKEGCERERLYT